MKRKLLSLLLCLSLFVSVLIPTGFVAAQTGDTAKITVNYVYEKNQAMVAQPYSATVQTGQPFQARIALPKILNYTIIIDSANPLPDGVTLDSKNNLLNIDLQTVTEDVRIVLFYRAGEADYTVTSWKQKLGSEEYECMNTVYLTGSIDAYTDAKAEQMKGFSSRVEQGIIAADNSTVVNIYYDRLLYTVVFDPNGGTRASDPIYAEYGTTFEESYVEQPTRPGYVFKGWSPEINYTITESVTYVAQWEKESDTADYTIVIWGQNANDEEYSYLGYSGAYGQTDTEVKWDPDAYICQAAHQHNENCYRLTCTKEEHTHTADCGLDCKHQHDLSCFGLTTSDQETKPDQITERNPVSGTVYSYTTTTFYKQTHYYLYLSGSWYCHHTTYPIVGSIKSDTTQITLNCTHIHDNSCYTCGKEEHTHTAYDAAGGCYELICPLESHTHTADCRMGHLHPGEDLWVFKNSDPVTITADGKAVLNVYFDRKEFTLTFHYNWNQRNQSYQNQETITARWGQNIKDQYEAISNMAGDTFWSEKYSGDSPWTNYIGVMPQENKPYYLRHNSGDGTSTMTYYGDDLSGNPQMIFSLTFVGTGYTVSKEDFYKFEGYTFDEARSTKEGKDCNGAEFYYTRDSNDLVFFSGNENVRTNSVKYQENLGSYDWQPFTPPADMETDAKFMGWYLNPQCTGEKYVFSAHTMPANNVVLYAKWVNGLYTVETFTDETMTEHYTYDGYTGVEKNIVKYTRAAAPDDPAKPGVVFVGWFYRDETGAEKPFSFTMTITRDYKLYPKFSNKAVVSYTVRYVDKDTGKELATEEHRQAQIGSSVTEKAKMGTELNLAEDGTLYFPEETSTSVVLNEADQVITFYYKTAAQTTYTVRYVDTEGKELLDSKTVTTSDSVVTEFSMDIPGYTARMYSQSLELSADPKNNVITFVYDPSSTKLEIWKSGADEALDPDAHFVFHIKGAEPGTSAIDMTVTIKGNGHIPITGLPVGRYSVEETDWSWRYTPQNARQEITLDAGGSSRNQLTFQNTRDNGRWLDGEASCINRFESASA